MDLYNLAAIILTIAIFVAYINHRYIKMQTTIAIMSASLLLSLLLIILSQYFGLSDLQQNIATQLLKIDFHKLLINGMLSFLLFGGALTIDLHTLRNQKWEIAVLSSFSTIASSFLVGILTYYLLPVLGFHLDFIYCLLFGALISPTDPIAVLSTFKQLGAPKELDVTVAGESLFNDGVGIVMFLTIYQIAFANQPLTLETVSLLFLRQAIGGLIYGTLLGLLASWLTKYADDHKIEILLTIAVVTGGYALGQALEISGPLAMVVAGIIIGNHARHHYMTTESQKVLDEFWELIDELLNAVLFLLIGFELLVVHINYYTLLAALAMIPLVLLVRYVTVAFPMGIFKIFRQYHPYTITILVWGGLRGGLAVALALSLPNGSHREVILAMTYAVVAFAVIIQGLSVAPLVRLTQRNHSLIK
jgi:CPA1 family monovalent cation:H+ antiporter